MFWTLCNIKCDKWVIVRLSIYLTPLLKHQLRSEHGPKYLISLLGNESVYALTNNLKDTKKCTFYKFSLITWRSWLLIQNPMLQICEWNDIFGVLLFLLCCYDLFEEQGHHKICLGQAIMKCGTRIDWTRFAKGCTIYNNNEILIFLYAW